MCPFSVSEARALLQKRLPGRRQMRAQVPVPHGAVGERQPAAERGRRAEGVMLVSPSTTPSWSPNSICHPLNKRQCPSHIGLSPYWDFGRITNSVHRE
ncbi:hypothetical protein CDAR_501851 [Caerostris darwini]|uniref:Uncharacterized protein n=1 Tax=Caerostris darwini TaxID=1538125 RepID=A0AAV4TRI9_9ARAC|nr:hypothetical protein CDAR_501851 [Caerostris darwini]